MVHRGTKLGPEGVLSEGTMRPVTGPVFLCILVTTGRTDHHKWPQTEISDSKENFHLYELLFSGVLVTAVENEHSNNQKGQQKGGKR